jgi:hypothetical protein
MVLQLFGRQVGQDIGNVSSNVSPGCEGNLRVAIATDRHFPTCDIEVQESALLLTEWLSIDGQKRTVPKSSQRMVQ